VQGTCLLLVDDVLRFSSVFYFDKYLDSEKIFKSNRIQFEQNIINRIKFKFEQISNLNKFQIWTNSNLNKSIICTFFKSEQKTNLNKIRNQQNQHSKNQKETKKRKNLRTPEKIGKQKESPYVLALMGRPTPSVAWAGEKGENGPGPIPDQGVRCLVGTDLVGV
jgi:hypothetical protein